MKTVAIDENNNLIYSSYERHYSQIIEKGKEMLSAMLEKLGDCEVSIALSGSAGMGLAEAAGITFVQEVYATRIAALTYIPNTDVIIELGGEDAKILFLSGGLEARMNGTCAGGTGAFIDQMATLLGIGMNDVDRLSEQSTELYTIASRCGVFAKSDIQPLINQGARTEDIASSILVAVVNQTIAGLAQGRKIEGKILYLGGPLTFLKRLRYYFDQALNTEGICPENSLYYVALGSAIASDQSESLSLSYVINALEKYKGKNDFNKLDPLFANREEYEKFKERHEKATVPLRDPSTYKGRAYLGIDAGSTTIKTCLLAENGDLLLSRYSPNNGNPVQAIQSFLNSFYENFPDITIASSASTGYGEDLLKAAFSLDFSLVETEAHFLGAKHFMRDVDFIIDIGGQDIKCFRIRDGVIDDIFLNEACSSGCGSFLQTFANALGKSAPEFASLAIDAKNPVDLGSKCTVFMNSQVKQAQKDGASINDISAGLAISVVKNALYKVIRASGPDEIGKKIVTQGGTFLNDAVLRAFEMELKTEVVRPQIAGLMGAYGSALYAFLMAKKKDLKMSSIITAEELYAMVHNVKNTRCGACTNNCLLTINIFGTKRRLISGNKCERPISGKMPQDKTKYNLYAYKQQLLSSYRERKEGKNGTIGLPLALGIYELLPFYVTLFQSLGYDTVVSPFSSRELYIRGQSSIPSDTVCFPAKLMHGAVDYLVRERVDRIFIPCSSYNLDEEKGTNHYNCPVVAYYGEVIKANQDLNGIPITLGYLSPDNSSHFTKRISELFSAPKRTVKSAVKKAFDELARYRERIIEKGKEIIGISEAEKREIIVLAGRPYHTDPEINHGIDSMIVSLGASVITEDSLAPFTERQSLNVLNQWTYHARMYDAARYVATRKDMNIVQLVSFGCGLDAVTTDEVKEILRRANKIYTQLKIDEITNLGAVRIRMRSLFAALEMEA